MQLRRLGRTAVEVPTIAFGGAALSFGRGEVEPLNGAFRHLTDGQASETLDAAWAQGVRFYDTAPWYGRGLSEHRIGASLWARPRAEFVVNTKVGRVLRRPRGLGLGAAPRWESGVDQHEAGAAEAMSPLWGGLPYEHDFDYSYDGIMRAFEDSLQRLRLNRVDTLTIHDLDDNHFSSQLKRDAQLAALYTSGWRALDELKRGGDVGAVGAGVNNLGDMDRFLDTVPLDFFSLSQRYTLAEQDTLETGELQRCEAEGVGVIAAAIFNSGLLVRGTRGLTGVPVYNYAPAPEAVLRKVGAIEDLCDAHGVELPAAALQFPLAHPCVASVVVGMSAPQEIEQNISRLNAPIPLAFWAELKEAGLLREDAPTPTEVAGGGTH
jgi:D-threo-aldose 1-dehydrogenase